MVQKAWIKAMSTRAAIRPRTMYNLVSERSKKESSVSLAFGSEELLSTKRLKINKLRMTYKKLSRAKLTFQGLKVQVLRVHC